jgi:hypothetical protein
MNPHRSRLLGLLALAGAAITVTACGGSSKPPPAPGSPQKPLVAKQTGPSDDSNPSGRSNEAASSTPKAKRGSKSSGSGQSRDPQGRVTPCDLVTNGQAHALIGQPMLAPVEAAQGPTCIYRSRDGRSFVTLAVQSLDFKRDVKPHLELPRRVAVSKHKAYCGTYGQPMLYVPLSGGRVLSVAAHCALARQFAVRALGRLHA